MKLVLSLGNSDIFYVTVLYLCVLYLGFYYVALRRDRWNVAERINERSTAKSEIKAIVKVHSFIDLYQSKIIIVADFGAHVNNTSSIHLF